MDFSFTREQDDLRHAVRSFLRKRAGDGARRSLLTEGYTFDHALWASMARDLGLPTIAVAEERGGSGAGFLESAIVFEELGRDLYAGPYFSTVVAAWVVEAAEGPTADAVLAEVANGGLVLTPAISDESGTWSAPGATTRALATTQGHRLSGTKSRVTDAVIATAFVVWAHLPEGPAWFLVRSDDPGVTVTEEESLDITRPIGTIRLADAEGTILVGPDRAAELLELVGIRAAAALAAEMVGGAQAALDQSVAWSKSRHQFGRPIGSFQALKHLCADALVEIEAAKVLTHYASWAIGAGRADASLLASMAKQAASDAYAQAAGNNIQIHGGIGFTWEHEAHLGLRKARASGALFGTARHHRNRIAELLAL